MGKHKSKNVVKKILTAYRIRNRRTGKFRSGGLLTKYTTHGKTWGRKRDLVAHIGMDKGWTVVYEHPSKGWLTPDEWEQVEDGYYDARRYFNYPSRKETFNEMLNRKFSPDDEVIEILVDENLRAEINVYSLEKFLAHSRISDGYEPDTLKA